MDDLTEKQEQAVQVLGVQFRSLVQECISLEKALRHLSPSEISRKAQELSPQVAGFEDKNYSGFVDLCRSYDTAFELFRELEVSAKVTIRNGRMPHQFRPSGDDPEDPFRGLEEAATSGLQGLDDAMTASLPEGPVELPAGLADQTPINSDQSSGIDLNLPHFAGARLEAFAPFYGQERAIMRLGDLERADSFGFTGANYFKALYKSTTLGIFTAAMSEAAVSGKHQYGEFATLDTQALWRFDVFPGSGAPGWTQDIKDVLRSWANDSADSAELDAEDVVVDALCYDVSDGSFHRRTCWIRVSFQKCLGEQALTPSQTDQWNAYAGKEMVPVHYRV